MFKNCRLSDGLSSPTHFRIEIYFSINLRENEKNNLRKSVGAKNPWGNSVSDSPRIYLI